MLYVCFLCAHPCSVEARQIHRGNILKQSLELGSMNWMLELGETQTDDENCKIRECVNMCKFSKAASFQFNHTLGLGKNKKDLGGEKKRNKLEAAEVRVFRGEDAKLVPLHWPVGGRDFRAPVNAAVPWLLEELVPDLRAHWSVRGWRRRAGLHGTGLGVGRCAVVAVRGLLPAARCVPCHNRLSLAVPWGLAGQPERCRRAVAGRVCAPGTTRQRLQHGGRYSSWLLAMQHISWSSSPWPPLAIAFVSVSSPDSCGHEIVPHLGLRPLLKMKLESFNSVAKDCSRWSAPFQKTEGFACLMPSALLSFSFSNPCDFFFSPRFSCKSSDFCCYITKSCLFHIIKSHLICLLRLLSKVLLLSYANVC